MDNIGVGIAIGVAIGAGIGVSIEGRHRQETTGYPTLVFINKDQYIFEYGGYYDTSALTTTINETL